MTQASGRRRASAVAAALFAAATVAALVAGPLPFDEPLFYVLVPLAIAGNLIPARYEGATVVSPEFGCSMMAVAFLGPLGVYLINVVAELGASERGDKGFGSSGGNK